MTSPRVVALAGLLLCALGAAASERETVLVAGATGSIGRLVIAELVARDYEVRGLTRNPGRAREQFGGDYEWIGGDVRDPAQIESAMRGVGYLICSIGYTEFEGPNGPQFVDYMGVRNLVDAAREQGVRHFVLVSASSAGPYRDHTRNPRFGYVAFWKTKGEDYLKQSGLSFTIVGPGGYLNEPGNIRGVRIFPRSDFRMGYISRADVAAIVVESLTNPDARGKSFAAQYDDTRAPGDWRSEFAALEPE